MIEFSAGIEGPCARCRGPGGRMREVLDVRVRLGGFTVDRLFCDPCEVEARALESEMRIQFAALIGAGSSPAAACGALVSKIDLALRGHALAA